MREIEEVSRMIRLNVLTVTDLTMLHATRTVKRGHGSILNVSSIAGCVMPHSLEAAYAASKAYIVSFSESVGHDLRGTGVTCTHLAPGLTRTGFVARLVAIARLEQLETPPSTRRRSDELSRAATASSNAATKSWEARDEILVVL